VDKEFVDLKKEIQSSRVVQITHGKVVGDFDLKARRK
jgi:hypothetical protein